MSYILSADNILRVRAVKTDSADDNRVPDMTPYYAFTFSSDVAVAPGQAVPSAAVCTADHRETKFETFTLVGLTGNAVAAGLNLPDQRPWGGTWPASAA
jgi:hypothetical protein